MSITPEDLAYMRTTQEGALPQEGTNRKATRTRDATGAWSTAYGAASAAIDCRLGLPTDTELRRDLGDRWEADPRWVLTVPATADVDVGDRFTVTGGPVVDVIGRLSDSESWETARRLAVVEAP